MKSSFCIDLQRFMLIPTKFPLSRLEALSKYTALHFLDFLTEIPAKNESTCVAHRKYVHFLRLFFDKKKLCGLSTAYA